MWAWIATVIEGQVHRLRLPNSPTHATFENAAGHYNGAMLLSLADILEQECKDIYQKK